MKTLTFLIILLSYNSFSQILIFNEDFQKGIPNEWKTVTLDTNKVNTKVAEYSSAWIPKVDPSDSSDTVVSSTSYFQYPGKADRWLISPKIQLGKFGNYLSWSAKSQDASFPDNYIVLVSTSNDINTFNDTVGIILQEKAEWTTYDINLKKLALEEKEVYFAFVLNTFDGYKLYLDDIQVRKEDPVSVEEISKLNNGINIYPIPCSDLLNVASNSDITSVSAYDLFGKNISLKTNKHSNSITTSHLNDGVYYLKITTVNGNEYLEKFVVKH